MADKAVIRLMSASEFRSKLLHPVMLFFGEAHSQAFCRGASSLLPLN